MPSVHASMLGSSQSQEARQCSFDLEAWQGLQFGLVIGERAGAQARWAQGGADDTEDEHDGAEPDEADNEPSIGYDACTIIAEDDTGQGAQLRLDRGRLHRWHHRAGP